MGKFTGLGTYLSALSKSTQKVNVKGSQHRTKTGKVVTQPAHRSTRKKAAEPKKRYGWGEEPAAVDNATQDFCLPEDLEHREFWMHYGLPMNMRRRLAEVYVAEIESMRGSGAASDVMEWLDADFVRQRNTDVLVKLRGYGVEPLDYQYLAQAGITIKFGRPTEQDYFTGTNAYPAHIGTGRTK